MFKKILIANRGEIACRIMRTCKKMGVRTVAVYSEADSYAPHVEEADEAYSIGPSLAKESYLNIQILLDVAKLANVDAIHPGYGFLSENADFATAVEAAGLTFIGPSPHLIQLMGDKLQAKAIARQANLSLLPGSEAALSTSGEVKALAEHLGYPLLLKAAAGGGGKGMRVIWNEEQVDEHVERTTSEALSSFKDGRIFVEKYLESPRHIEIQILGDKHGSIVHLGERDCSLQRRHQKIVEECPSPFMTSELRQAMVDQAVALAKHVGYFSAGTVEFMVEATGKFYFLEMNTRLQVEHAITEMVTNLDMVEQMIRIAAGEPLSFKQKEVTFSGHAIEVRLYAEDAFHNFMPSSGRITHFEVPPMTEGLRLDSGVEAGSEVSIYYDPMFAKLISWAPTRAEALHHMQESLAQFVIDGPSHNIGFLEFLLRQDKIKNGDYATSFIEHEMTFEVLPVQKQLARAIAVLVYHRTFSQEKDADTTWVIAEQKEGLKVKVRKTKVTLEKETFDIDLHWQPRERRFRAIVEGQTYYGQVRLDVNAILLTLFGITHKFQIMSLRAWELSSYVHTSDSSLDDKSVKAPMPGVLISVPVSIGDVVRQGQTLLVIEAMKMENALKSPMNATVVDVLVRPGENVMRNQVLVKLE